MVSSRIQAVELTVQHMRNDRQGAPLAQRTIGQRHQSPESVKPDATCEFS